MLLNYNPYMRKKILILPFFALSLLLSGCAQKVKIKALEPAQIDRATHTKKIAVVDFKYDRVGLASKIESNLANYKIDAKAFFTMVSRSDISNVIREQKLQNSGLVDTKDIVDVGNFIGAQAIISGNVGRITSSDSHFYEKRTECLDKKCKEYRRYEVRCTKRLISLSADIKMVDVAKGDIIFADSISKARKYKHCIDDSRALPSKETVAQKFAQYIANDFTHKLSPHYRYFEVELLEDADLDYTDSQKKLLKSALKYIEHQRLDKAERLLTKLVDSTMQQSYVAFYNLGVVKESQGDYKKAQKYYHQADSLTIEPVESVDNAYVRINRLIEQRKQTQEQLKR